jgi:hypothetical protein
MTGLDVERIAVTAVAAPLNLHERAYAPVRAGSA